MWGTSRSASEADPEGVPPMNLEWVCPHCDSVNVFRHSTQPVEYRPAAILVDDLPSGSSGRIGKMG